MPRDKVFVGLGEGIGNIIMGLPLVDTITEHGADVFLHLLPTPEGIRDEMCDLITAGRDHVRTVDSVEDDRYDVACLTHWWLTLTHRIPKADVIYVGEPPSDSPEILANLKAAGSLLAHDPHPRARIEPTLLGHSEDPHRTIGIHPGCKDHPAWKAMKVYPRWAEVTHRLKDLGARVVILGTPADDAYCGEPHKDLRGKTQTLDDLREEIEQVDCLVSGDSGLHHLAVALGVPTVALFGQSSVAKAHHPDPIVRPVIFGPGFDSIDPRAVAHAAVVAATR